jgi:signal transduction histidine kinase
VGALVALVISIVVLAGVKSTFNVLLQNDITARYNMRTDLQRAFAVSIDEETGVRGYVATHRTVFLAPYYAASGLAPGYFSALRSDSGPDLLADARSMDALHTRWVREVAIPLIARPDRSDALRIALLGKTLMDRLRADAGDFRQKNGADIARDIRRDAYVAIGTFVLLVLFVLGFATLGLRFERERLRAERDLRRQIAQRNLELERSNQALAEFAYVASHDLQEPLRTVASFTQLLARRYAGKLDAQADEFIGYAVDGALRMQALVNDILEYSRVTTHGAELAPVDLNDVVTDVLAGLRTSIAERGAQVDVGALPTVRGDERQLGQLFQNLIVNALKYNRSDTPTVSVSARPSDADRWEISIADNGIGIAPEYHERIFRIFARLHAREEYSGTGIGLSICNRIVDRHGGRMWVDSEEGRGATFHFTLASASSGTR